MQNSICSPAYWLNIPDIASSEKLVGGEKHMAILTFIAETDTVHSKFKKILLLCWFIAYMYLNSQGIFNLLRAKKSHYEFFLTLSGMSLIFLIPI